MACATGSRDSAAWLDGSRLRGAAAFAAAAALAGGGFGGDGFRADLGCDGFRRRLLCGQLWFLGFLRLCGLCSRSLGRHCVSLQARYWNGGRFAGRGIIPASFCLYSRLESRDTSAFFDEKSGQFDRRGGRQPVLAPFDDHCGVDTAPDIEFARQPRKRGCAGAGQIVGDLVGHGLVKGAAVAKRPQVELQRLELDAAFVRARIRARRWRSPAGRFSDTGR